MKTPDKFDINIAKEFSEYPAGRFYSDGDASGQEFREKFLVPLLKQGKDRISINLDGTEGYGSSFLEEAFGGLVREGFSSEMLLRVFVFKSEEDPTILEEIQEYIQNGGNPKEY